jgi:hypothetical protein
MLLSLFVGLFFLCVALLVERLMLSGRTHILQAKECAYRFHALRDELQLMAASRRLDTSSLTYSFLMFSLNLAIKNAGTMKLRDILRLADTVKERIEATRFEAIKADITTHDSSVGELAGRIFHTFYEILVSNDRWVSIAISMHRHIRHSWADIRPLLEWIDRRVAAILTVFAPTKVNAAVRARQYQHWAERLGSY